MLPSSKRTTNFILLRKFKPSKLFVITSISAFKLSLLKTSDLRILTNIELVLKTAAPPKSYTDNLFRQTQTDEGDHTQADHDSSVVRKMLATRTQSENPCCSRIPSKPPGSSADISIIENDYRDNQRPQRQNVRELLDNGT